MGSPWRRPPLDRDSLDRDLPGQRPSPLYGKEQAVRITWISQISFRVLETEALLNLKYKAIRETNCLRDHGLSDLLLLCLPSSKWSQLFCPSWLDEIYRVTYASYWNAFLFVNMCLRLIDLTTNQLVMLYQTGVWPRVWCSGVEWWGGMSRGEVRCTCWAPGTPP